MAASVQRIHRDYLARLIAERDACAVALGGDAYAAQRSATTLLTRFLFLRQLHVWGVLPGDTDFAEQLNEQTSLFSDLFMRSPTHPLILSSCDRVIVSSCQLPDDAPFSSLISALVESQGDQKRQGAYYTSADVSGYIAAQCIVPALLDALAQRCPTQLAVCWRLLQNDPDRYIPATVRHGCELPLPAEIERGLDNVAARVAWNVFAPGSHALSNEIWREVVARRERYTVLRDGLRRGAACTPNDIVTLNLDGQQFIIDILERGQDAELLVAFDDALTSLTIFDPTCGSGAFLLAALQVLRRLYVACAQQKKMSLDTAKIITTIIAHNLYGVDIVPEAVEACRLRLYLAYASEVQHAEQLQVPCELQRNICVGNILASTPANVHRSAPFDVTIGNPPYLSLSKAPYVVRGYATEPCGNLYALVVECALTLLKRGGRLGMIVPIASIATDAMRPLQQLYQGLWQWHSHYAVRPGKLFPDVDMNLTITLLHNERSGARCYGTGYQRWSARAAGERARLFSMLTYTENPRFTAHATALPKLGSLTEVRILSTMLAQGQKLRQYVTNEGTLLYYHSGGRYWRKAALEQHSSHYKPLCIPTSALPFVFCLLNSQLFYWYWIGNSNCMDVVLREVLELPVGAIEVTDTALFSRLMQRIIDAYQRGSTTRARRGQRINVDEINVDARAAKLVIDDIDRALATWYGFTDTETDFLINYDIKYRLAQRTSTNRY